MSQAYGLILNGRNSREIHQRSTSRCLQENHAYDLGYRVQGGCNSVCERWPFTCHELRVN